MNQVISPFSRDIPPTADKAEPLSVKKTKKAEKIVEPHITIPTCSHSILKGMALPLEHRSTRAMEINSETIILQKLTHIATSRLLLYIDESFRSFRL